MKTKIYSDQLMLAATQKAEQRKYWLEHLSGELVKSHFPYDYKIKSNDICWQRMEFQLEQFSCERLLKLSNRSDYSLNSILLTVLTLLIYKYTGNNDIIVGTPIYKPDMEGNFINTVLALRNRIPAGITFKELLIQMSERIYHAVENQDYPIEALTDELNMMDPGIGFPLFDIILLLENIHDKKFIRDFNHNMTLSFSRTHEHIRAVLDYNSNLFEKATIKKIIQSFKVLLHKVILDLDAQVSHIDLLLEEEKQRFLYEFNWKSDFDQPRKTLDQLFEEQVSQTPGHIALLQRDSQLTYQELNKRANRLARWLRKKGVGTDIIVGILIDRSPEMIMGILAVLKAGGAYLPLDSQLPEKRIIYLLEDCQVTILLTQNKVVKDFFLPALLGFPSYDILPVVTAPRPRIEMDDLPMMDRSLVDYSKYSQHIGYAGVKNCISLEATRGCPFGCIYCHKIFPRKHVFRSYEDILAEVEFYYRLGVRRFLFIDDIFNLNVQNSTKFFRMVIKNKLDIQIFFSGGLRGDILTKDYIDLMVEAGTVLMTPALETASPRLQKLIKKNLNLEKLKENLEYICQAHPEVILELFVMHGFPTETREEAMMTMNFIKRIKWVHFPYINILRIFSQTEMAKFAVENGIPYDAIHRSEHLAFHELPETLPFDPSFTREFQTRFQEEYFLSKERLMDVLPHQMKVMTENELVQKYNSYLSVGIHKFQDLLELADIKENELDSSGFLTEEHIAVPHFNERLKKHFQEEPPLKNALNVLILDLSLYFSNDREILYDLMNEPLGPVRLLTQLKQKFGKKVNGKVMKSRIDFNNFNQLKNLIDEFKPHVIGIRTLTFYRDLFHKTVSIIRQWGICVPIIVGGPHVTTNYRETLKDANIDLAVLGEGEITFCEIIEHIMENGGKCPDVETLKEIPGIAFVADRSQLKRKFPRQILILETIEEQLDCQDHHNLKGIKQSRDLVYVNFTSGSTGKPKGIMVEHGNLAGYLKAFFHEFDISGKDTVLQQASFSFDTFGEEIYPVLLRGGKVVIIDRMELLDLHFFSGCLPKYGITLIDCSPLLLNELNKTEAVKGVDLFISGGDVLKNMHINHLAALGKVYNTYGPTESTICATYYRCPADVGDSESLKSTVPIGKPIANYQVYILDKDHLILPIGIPGEICIGGIGISRGYLNNPMLTKEKYIPHPFIVNQRLYKTGDVAKWLPDGNIDYLGRIDHQVKIRGYRIEIGEIERQIMQKGDITDVVVIAHSNNSLDGLRENVKESAHESLVAFFVSQKQQPVMELREYLIRELPAYMIPTHFVQLETLPLTPGGKVDRGKLAVMDTQNSYKEKYTAPTNEIEKKLVIIWQQVLGRNPVGIDDNFFMIGGDSIKSIQITARMNQLGYKVQMKDIFQNPSIQKLAPLVKKLDCTTSQDSITGIVPLTPVQTEFFLEGRQFPYHFNHAIMLFSREVLDETALKTVFEKIHHHHDALRMTFKKEKGKIIQRIHGLDYPISLQVHNLHHITDKFHTFTAVRHKAGEIQTQIDLETGPLTQLALFHTQYGDYLLIAIHHLVVDGISWRILMEDIENLYWRYQQKKELLLPPKTDSFKIWAENIIQYANSEAFLKEKSYWEKLDLPSILPIKKDFDVPTFIKDTTSLSFTLSPQVTHLLLNRVNHAFGTEINDILLTALGLAIKKTWGHKRVAIAMEGHGREDIFPHLQVSRTIGWFTSVYPVVLNLSFADNLSRQIKEIKENLHQVPGKGIGYGILKYLTMDIDKKDLNFHWHPQVTFNYLGQFDSDVEQMSSFQIANHLTGNTMAPEEKRLYELEISGMIANNQLQISVDYVKKQYKIETMEIFMSQYREQLERIIEFCSTREKSEPTPSDLTYKLLSIEMLEALANRYEIQDIYRLSPMQEGMLFHALSGNRIAFFEQISYRMKGKLDIEGVEYSLNQLVKRYDILRTNFIYEGLEYPLQVVQNHCRLEFFYEDLSENFNGQNKKNQINAFLEEIKEKDRQRSFNMENGVLMRVAIFQLTSNLYEFIWSIHHILMDGWCQGIIITDFMEIYSSYMQKRLWTLPPVKPYRSYIQWLEKQNQEKSLIYWEKYLQGYGKRAVLPQQKEYHTRGSKFQLDNYIVTLDKEMSAHLDRLAKKNNVTLNIIMQTIWGIILARWNYQKDVVFGVVVSGRPPEIEGIENMVGLFVNTIPLRIRFDENTTFKQLIRKGQDEAVESEKHHFISLAEIQSKSVLKEELIHHIFVFENYPLIDQLNRDANINPGLNPNKTPAFTISNVDTYEQTNYDLYLQIFPEKTIRINLGYNANIYEKDLVQHIGNQINILARQIISDELQNIEDLILYLLVEENDGISGHRVVINEPPMDIYFNI